MSNASANPYFTKRIAESDDLFSNALLDQKMRTLFVG